MQDNANGYASVRGNYGVILKARPSLPTTTAFSGSVLPPETVRPRTRVLSPRIVPRRAFHDDELFRAVRKRGCYASRRGCNLQGKPRENFICSFQLAEST